MKCSNCDPDNFKAGKLIYCTPDREHCAECGRSLIMNQDYYSETIKRWDNYFHSICVAVATKSPCLSRQIGAILVRDKSIIATGYNGPARGYPHCEGQCSRHLVGFKSGEGLEYCPASHAEMNCIANAARIGTNTCESTLYMNSLLPCKFCAVILVNAGIKEIVVDDTKPYHEMSIEIFVKGNVNIRRFKL